MRWQNIKTIQSLPRRIGVYLFRGKEGILYIGKAANIHNRVKTHFQQPTFRDTLFINQVTGVGYQVTGSEIEALLLESQLIKKYQPKYNVVWKDDKNYFYVAITKERLPRIFITHQPSTSLKCKIQNAKCKMTSQNSKFIGPFVDGGALKRTLRFLRRIFPYYTKKKHPRLPCSWCHLGLCPGPNPDQKQYRKNIRAIKNILLGKSSAVIKSLKKEMGTLAKKRDYEKAANLRDQIRAMESIMENAKILGWEIPQSHSFTSQAHTYFVGRGWEAVEKKVRKILNIKRRISRIEGYDISNIQGQQATGSMVVFINGKPAKEHYRKFRVKISGRPNDVAMIKEIVKRRLAHAEWGLPDIMLIDGGVAQLNGTLKAKKELQILKKIKIVSLAKRKNELFIENCEKPILLKNCPQDVTNLILYVRDEAHRFAKRYHHHLRSYTLLG